MTKKVTLAIFKILSEIFIRVKLIGMRLIKNTDTQESEAGGFLSLKPI